MFRKGATELSNGAKNEQGDDGVKSVCEGNGDNEWKKCFKIGEESVCEVGGNGETESHVTGR